MEIRITEELCIQEILQAIYEQLTLLEANFGIRHSKGLTIYLNPTNGFGDAVVALRKNGAEITKIQCTGPYRSVADEYNI